MPVDEDVEPPPGGALTRRVARSTAIRAAADIAGKVATLAWTVAAARMLSIEDFGSFSYALALTLLLGSLAEWGYDAGLVRRASGDLRQLPSLYLAIQVEKTVLALVVSAAAAVVVHLAGASPRDLTVLMIMLFAGIPEIWSHTARSVASAAQSPAGISAALVLQRVVTGIAIVAALVLGWGTVGAAAGFLAGTLVGWFAHRRVAAGLGATMRWSGLRRGHLRTARAQTLLIGASGLVLMLLFRLDVVLISALRGEAEVAAYSVAYRLLETVLFVTYAVNSAVLPVMTATTSTRRLRLAYERGAAVTAFVYLPFAVVCVSQGRWLLTLLFGESYGESSTPVLAWLAAGPIFFAAAFLGGSVLIATARFRLLVGSSVLALVVNIALNLVLIPTYGGVGAAVATTTAYLAQTVVVRVALRDVPEPPRVLVPMTCPALGAAALAVVLVVLRLPAPVELGIGGAVYLVVWIACARRLAPEQLVVVRDLVLRRGRP